MNEELTGNATAPIILTGLPEADLSAIMGRMEAKGVVDGRQPRQEPEQVGQGGEWDKLTLLTGGFVPVGSIFWARPPKLKNQQRIMLTMQRARNVMQPFYAEGAEAENVAQQEGFLEALFEQGAIMAKLAADIYYVYECERRQEDVTDLLREGKLTLTKADFRPATEDELTNDETGLTAEEIFNGMNRLMAIQQESGSGNA